MVVIRVLTLHFVRSVVVIPIGQRFYSCGDFTLAIKLRALLNRLCILPEIDLPLG